MAPPSLAKNTLLTMASSGLITIMGMVSGIIIARFLGPEGKGQVTAILLWPPILVWVSNLGLDWANIYNIAKSPERTPKLFANSLLAALVFGVSILIAAELLIPKLIKSDDNSIIWLVRLCLLTIPLMLFNDYMMTIFQGHRRFDLYNLMRIVRHGSYVAPICILALFSYLSVKTTVVAYFIMVITSLIVELLVLIRFFPISLAPNLSLLKSSLSYGLKVHGGAVAELANSRLDQMVLVATLSAYQVGLYSVGVTMSEFLCQIPIAVSLVLFPAASARSSEDAKDLIAKSLRVNFVFMIGGAALLFVLCPAMIEVLVGRDFLPVVTPLRILLVASIALGMTGIIRAGLNGLGYPLYGTYGSMVSLGIMIPLLLVLIPRFGIIGAAMASLVGYTANFVTVLGLLIFKAKVSPSNLFLPTKTDLGYLSRAGKLIFKSNV